MPEVLLNPVRFNKFKLKEVIPQLVFNVGANPQLAQNVALTRYRLDTTHRPHQPNLDLANIGTLARKRPSQEAKEKVLRPHEMIERASQELLDDPDRAHEIMDMLHVSLSNHYRQTGMLTRAPEKAAMRIARSERQAVQTAIGNIIALELIRQTLPALRRGESLMPGELSTDPDYYTCGAIQHAYEGEADTFMRAGTALLRSATDTVFDTLEADELHPYHQLYKLDAKTTLKFQQAINAYKSTKSELTIGEKSVLTHHDTRDTWKNILEPENILSFLQLLFVAKEGRSTKDESASELTNKAIIASPELGWLMTANRHASHRIFGFTHEYIYEELHVNISEGSYGNIFVETDDSNGPWVDRSLQKESWRVPGHCSGRIGLRPPKREDREAVEEFYRIVEKRIGRPMARVKDGSFSTGEVELILGAYIAEDTIYKSAA